MIPKNRTPKARISPRRISRTGKVLSKIDKLSPYNKVSGVWHADEGRKLFNYRRLHAAIRKYLPRKSLKGKRVVHLGAGNGNLMHFLSKTYGVVPTSVEISRGIISRAKKRGVKANFVQNDARKMSLKSSSQDVVIADHFLFAKSFSPSAATDLQESKKVLSEAFRVLKPGGLLFIERATPVTVSYNTVEKSLERPYLDKGNLEGFEIVEHIEGVHDYPPTEFAPHVMLGFSRFDLHPSMDLVVLRKPLPGNKLFNPLDMFSK
jgi:SAM-dependent methyltransferase